jgi:hypothetical protein
MGEVLSRIYGPANVPSGDNTAFTVTSTHTYAVRSIRIVNNSSGAISIRVGINGSADANLIIPYIAIAAGQTYHDDGLVILASGDTLDTHTSATGLTISLHGLDSS